MMQKKVAEMKAKNDEHEKLKAEGKKVPALTTGFPEFDAMY